MLLVKGQYCFDLHLTEVVKLLEQVELIGDALVCINHLEMTGDCSYRFAMHLNVPKLGGFYRGDLQLKEVALNDSMNTGQRSYQIEVAGDRFGTPMHASGVMALEAIEESKTVLNYEVETNAFDNYDRHVQMIAKPVAPRIINRGLQEVESFLNQSPAQDEPDVSVSYANHR